MKKVYCSILLLMVAVALISCRGSLMARQDTAKWLQGRQSRSAAINIAGFWADAKGDGWQKGVFRQKGNTVSGSLGPYLVEGVVSGKTVYLVMIYKGRVDFIFKMRPAASNLLEGSYFRNTELREGVSVMLRSEKPIKNL